MFTQHTTKCGAEQICGVDQNSDSLWNKRAYLWINDYCSVMIRVRVMIKVRVRLG